MIPARRQPVGYILDKFSIEIICRDLIFAEPDTHDDVGVTGVLSLPVLR